MKLEVPYSPYKPPIKPQSLKLAQCLFLEAHGVLQWPLREAAEARSAARGSGQGQAIAKRAEGLRVGQCRAM